MVVKEDRPQAPVPAELDGHQNGSEEARPPYPYLGRSVRQVGSWESVDAAQTPHEKNKRGELGKPLFNWYHNRTSRDPLGRIATANASADRRNTLGTVIGTAGKGGINADKVDVTDPKAMTKHIKEVAKFLGIDECRIAAVHPSFLYAGSRYPDDGTGSTRDSGVGAAGPEANAKRYPYAIACVVAWDYNMSRAHRHRIGDAAYHFSAEKLVVAYANLAAYIRELGYSAERTVAQPMPLALAAGIGELGRHGMLITRDYGPRVHLGDPILTDLPLVPDQPIDIGVEDFCKVCKKCATTCPTNSISVEGKAVINGIEKYKINWETCYRLRPHVMEFWESCLTCVAACPYTKPKTWWHFLAVNTLSRTPIPLRSLVVWPLKWLDDLVWGKVPRKRVQFMSHDSAVLKVPKSMEGMKVPADGNVDGAIKMDGKTGIYYPLKENTRRFDILKEKRRASKAVASRR